MRLVIERGKNVLVIGFIVLALDGVDGNAVIANQRCRHVILRGERVGGAKNHVSAAIAQRNGQVCGLRGHVQARGNANALQRLVLDEFLADALEHRHGLVGPLNAALSQISQFQALDIVRNLRSSGC